jgi:hypothetical protein
MLPLQQPDDETGPRVEDDRVYHRITVVLQVTLVLGLVGFVLLQDWANALLTLLVIALTLAPRVLKQTFHVDVPPEFQLVAAVFVYAAIFLGTALGFYARFLWWDVALHTASGFLLGIVGFVALFLLNGTDYVPDGMRLSLVAVFGFMFAVTLGVFWEIYEFIADSLIPGLNMQIWEEGPRDTMIDLIVNTLGAATVAALGYFFCRTGRRSFIADGVRSFLQRNPHLVGGRHASHQRSTSDARQQRGDTHHEPDRRR